MQSYEVAIVFLTPKQVGDVVTWSGGYSLTPEQFVTEYAAADGAHRSVGYVVDRAVLDVAADYQAEIGGMLREEADLMAADAEITQSDRDHVAALATSVSAGDAPIGIVLGKATVGAINEMSADPDVGEIHWQGDISYGGGGGGGGASPSSTSSECSMWWPDRGRIVTQQPSRMPNRRYVWQWFRWSMSGYAQLVNCHERVTYEAEAWYDGDPSYLGSVTGWDTSMPKPYLDTEFANESREVGKTVGTSDARQLRLNYTYTTLVWTKHGTAATDRGKVSGQRGHRFWPGSCHRTWCIGGDETAFLFPAWDHTVPGANYWAH